MPLFNSRKANNRRLFEDALRMANSHILRSDDDESTKKIHGAWTFGASIMAGLLVEDKYLEPFWRGATQKEAYGLVISLIPAMMSRYYWTRTDQLLTKESQRHEFDVHLSHIYLDVLGASSTLFNTSFRQDLLNLDVQFNYECDWLQGKVTASESDGSTWIWDVLQFPDAYRLTDAQKKFVPHFFDIQYSLLSSLAKDPLVPHQGTPIFFEFVLWLDKCVANLGYEPSIQWSMQHFPIQGARQLIARGSSTIGQLDPDDFIGWSAALKTGMEAMSTFL